MNLYCFDFDGVICDSAKEMVWSGWHAAAELWPHLCTDSPSEAFIEKFLHYRPLIETGYQSILLTRMIRESMPEEQIATNFPATAKMLMDVLDVKEEALIERFATVRDRQIEEDPETWLLRHELYEGVVETINELIAAGHTVCIITTKQQRYTKMLVHAAGLRVPGKLTFGLEAGKKISVLKKLVKHPQLQADEYVFFEDRLKTLEEMAGESSLDAVALMYCTWGYTTATDRQRAAEFPRIQSLTSGEFVAQFGLAV